MGESVYSCNKNQRDGGGIMELREVKLYNPIKELFEKYGYEVKAEIPFFNSPIDLIAYSGNYIISVELKMSLTKGLIHKAFLNQLFSDFSYIAIPTNPRNIDKCIKSGLGIIRVKDGKAEILLDASFKIKPLSHYKKNILAWCDIRDPEMIGGKPMLKGEGPAQDCYKRVLKYKENNPVAKWKNIFDNVDNHYCSHSSMQNALSGFFIRDL